MVAGYGKRTGLPDSLDQDGVTFTIFLPAEGDEITCVQNQIRILFTDFRHCPVKPFIASVP